MLQRLHFIGPFKPNEPLRLTNIFIKFYAFNGTIY